MSTIHQYNKMQACYVQDRKEPTKHTIMKNRTRSLHVRWDGLGDVNHVFCAQLAVLGQGGDAPTKVKSQA